MCTSDVFRRKMAREHSRESSPPRVKCSLPRTLFPAGLSPYCSYIPSLIMEKFNIVSHSLNMEIFRMVILSLSRLRMGQIWGHLGGLGLFPVSGTFDNIWDTMWVLLLGGAGGSQLYAIPYRAFFVQITS